MANVFVSGNRRDIGAAGADATLANERRLRKGDSCSCAEYRHMTRRDYPPGICCSLLMKKQCFNLHWLSEQDILIYRTFIIQIFIGQKVTMIHVLAFLPCSDYVKQAVF